MRLSLRLRSLLDRCEDGLPVWDLCCDHGILGQAALFSGRYPAVIFNDSVKHVTDLLLTKLPARNDVRVICARAEEIEETLTGNVVIAGVGGEKVHMILNTHAQRGRLGATRIIACPEKDAEWLAAQNIPGFELIAREAIAHGRGTRIVFTYLRR